jgi:pyrroloquinoline quinone biosynthesis protein D
MTPSPRNGASVLIDSTMSASKRERIPVLRHGFRLQWEPHQRCWVLLYPEGMVKLSDSAGVILRKVDGLRSTNVIIEQLCEGFPVTPGVDDDILIFLEVAHAQHWIEFH